MAAGGRYLPWLVLFGVFGACCTASAEKITVTDGRPVDRAIQKLEAAYGWPITYEDTPRVYEGDLEDATSRVRRDGKSADEPGVSRILLPREQTFSFSFDPPQGRKLSGRAPAEQTRAAILAMLDSYASSVGGVRFFALTESNGMFHVVPVQRKDASGKLENIVPLFDAPVEIAPKGRSGSQLVTEICRALASRAGYPVGLGTGGANLLGNSRTSIGSKRGESARSVMSRFFAEVEASGPLTRAPFSWHAYYEPDWGYALNLRPSDRLFVPVPRPNGMGGFGR